MTKSGEYLFTTTVHSSNFLFLRAHRRGSHGRRCSISEKIIEKRSADLMPKRLLVTEQKTLSDFLLMPALSAIASKLSQQFKMLKNFWRFKKNSALSMAIFGNLSATSPSITKSKR